MVKLMKYIEKLCKTCILCTIFESLYFWFVYDNKMMNKNILMLTNWPILGRELGPGGVSPN